jgi:hypothetical protein
VTLAGFFVAIESLFAQADETSRSWNDPGGYKTYLGESEQEFRSKLAQQKAAQNKS